MKKFRLIVIFILFSNILLASDISLTSKEKEFLKAHPIIKAHNEASWAPFNFYRNGKAQGYTIDILNLMAKKLGISIEYISGPTWNEFLVMLEKKQIDIIGNMVQTKEREKYTIFTDPILKHQPGFFSKETNLIENIDQLDGKTVAFPKGYYYKGIFEKYNKNIKFHLVDSNLESIKSVLYGKADAAVGTTAMMQYLILENNIPNVVASGELNIKNVEKYYNKIGIRDDWPLLQSILNKALKSITVQEEQEIKSKWLKTFKKNDNKESKKINLTKKEQEYLQGKKDIKICVDPNFLPYESIDENGKYKGIGSDIINIVSKNLNKDLQLISSKTWIESLENIKNKKCDILPMAASTPNRKQYLNFTKPYIKDSVVVATKENEFFINDSSDLSNRRIGVVDGYAFIEILKKINPNIDLVKVKNAQDGLVKVQKGQLYGYVDTLPVIAYNIQKNAMLNLKVAGKLEFELGLSIASIIDEPHLNTIMQKAINTINKEQIDSIKGKWISIKVEQSFDYRILFYVVLVFLIVIAFMIYRHNSIKKMNKQLEKISITDALTNIYNRRYFNEIFPRVINSAKRKNELVSFLIMDIDHFKQYNDTYGHQMGDDVLIKVAASLKNSLHRSDDYCFRLGGEEFGVVFKIDSKEKALQFSEKIRKNIENLNIEHSGNSASPYVTASMGLISKSASDIKDEDEVYKEADDLLYEAKEFGRNRVCC